MKNGLMMAALVAAAVGAAPRVASASECNIDAVIEGCDKAFPLTSLFGEPLRGWCYIFGVANCAAS